MRTPERVGKYEVLAALTEGGMAQLFLGATAGPGGFRKYVVIKRVLPESRGDENLERMFLDEARVTAAFSHPGIAQVFDLGEDSRGLYVVMEFIAGQNLNQVVHACAKQQAVLPLGFSVAVVNECALALHYAHTFRTAAGEDSPVIHRDVAQKNVMVTYEGQVKLLDFGIAKVRNALARTKVGTVKGTAGYMSPEQVRGEVLDQRSDVFSLGVVLWEMVTGRRLFSGETELDELRQILDTEVTPPARVEPSVPEELSALVMRALEKRREHRFGSARELARTLQARCDGYLFDAEARAEFMNARFAQKIRSTRALFEVADSASTDEVDRAVAAYKGQARADDEAITRPHVKARVQLSASKLEGVRSRPRQPSKGKLKPVVVRREAAAREQEEALAREIEAAAREEPELLPVKKGSVGAPVLLGAVVVLLVAGALWYVAAEERQSPAPIASAEAAGLGGIPGAPEDSRRPAPGNEPVSPLPAAAATAPKTVTAAAVRPAHAPTAPRVIHAPGDVTLALLPGATVMLGERVLGEGSLVSFTLPEGTHVLTLVGRDGVSHPLSLPVEPGKNKVMKFHVDELPVR